MLKLFYVNYKVKNTHFLWKNIRSGVTQLLLHRVCIQAFVCILYCKRVLWLEPQSLHVSPCFLFTDIKLYAGCSCLENRHKYSWAFSCGKITHKAKCYLEEKLLLEKEKNVKGDSAAVSWNQDGNDCTNWWSMSLECLDSHSLQITVVVIRMLCLRTHRLLVVLMCVLDPFKVGLAIFIMLS